MLRRPPIPTRTNTPFPATTLCRSNEPLVAHVRLFAHDLPPLPRRPGAEEGLLVDPDLTGVGEERPRSRPHRVERRRLDDVGDPVLAQDRKSTRLNSSH